MFPWGAIVGLAGQAVSGVASVFNNKRTQSAADAEAARQEAYYNAQAMQDPLTRSENARLLAQYDRKAQQQVDNAQGVAAITGATPEYTLAVQKAVADGRADLMGGMAAEASERRDKYEDKAEEARHQKVLDDQERRAARNQTYANLAANAASAAGSIIDSYSSPNHNRNRDWTPMDKAVSPQKGLTITAPPTTMQNEISKMNAGLATIKQRNGW